MKHKNAMDRPNPWLSDLSASWNGPVETPNGVACDDKSGKSPTDEDSGNRAGTAPKSKYVWAEIARVNNAAPVHHHIATG